MAGDSLGMTAAAGLVMLPLAGAIAAFLSPRRAVTAIALAVTFATAALAAMVVAVLVEHGPVRLPVGAWGAPLGIELRADGLAVLMIAVTAAVMSGVALYSSGYLGRGGDRPERYWPIYFFLWCGLNALFLTNDIFSAYVALEIVSLAAVALVALGGRAAPLIAGLRYLLVALVGSLTYLLGVALLYGATGTLDFDLIAQRLTPGVAPRLALALMTVGLFAKAAFFPLHGWLPPAHASAPAPASALLSALVVKAGFYLMLRLWFEPFETIGRPEALRTLIGLCGAGAVLWGSMLAIAQRRIKPLLAYSTVAQLGYLLQLFPLAGVPLAWGGTLVIAVSHALAKAAMFLSAGLVIQALGHDRLDDIRGAAHTIPMTVFAFGLAGLSLVGLPPSGGFVGKWLLMAAALESARWYWAIVPIGGGLLASIYVFGVLARAFLGPAVSEPFSPVARSAEIAALTLAIASVLFGPFAWAIVQVFVPSATGGGGI